MRDLRIRLREAATLAEVQQAKIAELEDTDGDGARKVQGPPQAAATL